eukprot:SAG31_NODE_1774_length_7303_cov_4.685453_2_plen_96_part_00
MTRPELGGPHGQVLLDIDLQTSKLWPHAGEVVAIMFTIRCVPAATPPCSQAPRMHEAQMLSYKCPWCQPNRRETAEMILQRVISENHVPPYPNLD